MRIKLNLLVLLLLLGGAVTVQALFTIEENIKIAASDGVYRDGFGSSAILSGDTLVIGAAGSSYTGRAVYIFQRYGSQWHEQAKLTASANDLIGYSVAIEGNIIAAGSYISDDSTGAVYIFRRQGPQWLEQARLTASDGSAYDRFGISVAVKGDILAVGAPGSYIPGDKPGAVYLFQRIGTDWVEVAKLAASDGVPRDNFGKAIAMEGNSMVIGSSGAAYVFQRTNRGWIEQVKLTPSDSENACVFGSSLAIRKNIVVVGDFCNFQGFIFGAAYIYERNGANWQEQSKIQASDLLGEDNFGWSVAINERADTVAIGAPLYSGNGFYEGAAYIFKRNGNIWEEHAKLIPSDGTDGDSFGSALAISRDMVVVGASSGDGNTAGSGAIYIYYLP